MVSVLCNNFPVLKNFSSIRSNENNIELSNFDNYWVRISILNSFGMCMRNWRYTIEKEYFARYLILCDQQHEILSVDKLRMPTITIHCLRLFAASLSHFLNLFVSLSLSLFCLPLFRFLGNSPSTLLSFETLTPSEPFTLQITFTSSVQIAVTSLILWIKRIADKWQHKR